MIKMLSGNLKNLYVFSTSQLYAQAYVLICTLHSWQQKQLISFWAKLYTGKILLFTKNRRNKFFCLHQNETGISFTHLPILPFIPLHLPSFTPITFHSSSSTFIYPHYLSFSFICLHLSSLPFILLHLPSFTPGLLCTPITFHSPSSDFIYPHYLSFLFICLHLPLGSCLPPLPFILLHLTSFTQEP